MLTDGDNEKYHSAVKFQLAQKAYQLCLIDEILNGNTAFELERSKVYK